MAHVEPADRNLRLALLDEVYTDRVGAYWWLSSLREEYTAYRSSAGGPDWDEIEPRLGIDRLAELEQFLLTLPLAAEDLAKVTDLCLDGDREIYTLYPGWWHFGRHYSILDLDGLEHCTALADLNLSSMVEPCSLAPLAALTKLSRLTVDAIDEHRDLEVLIALPALVELKIVNFARTEDHERWPSVIGALRARGARVRGW